VGVANRLDLTLRLVQGAGQASVTELAQRLGVSEMTVRRDLDALERQDARLVTTAVLVRLIGRD